MLCKNCGKEVDNKAVICVHCGTSLKQKKNILKKWWFWVVVVLAIAVIGGAGSGGEDTAPDAGENLPEVSNDVAITYEKLDLRTMMNELEENAMKAEEKYQNKYVEITGQIAVFDSDGNYISIEPSGVGDWNFDTAMCYVTSDAQRQFLLEKSIGDKVVIKGKIKSIGEVLGYSLDIKEIS